MSNKVPLKIQIPSQGGKQFLTARKEMLDAFDNAKTQAKKNIVQTKHGVVAEAGFRKWLSDFLPKRYAVTSGYIISQGLPENTKAPHFDVIIYEHLESPVLWIEQDPDASEQGKSRAIPAEYVRAVIEVKSSFENKTVKKAIEHLAELQELMSTEDAHDARYKMHLPPNFFCSTVFFDLRKDNKFDKAALNSLKTGFLQLKNFNGGIILRGEGFARQLSGSLKFLTSNSKIKSNIMKPNVSLLSGGNTGDPIKINEELYLTPSLFWGEVFFSQYAFDLVALLNGTFQTGMVSSFHAFWTGSKDGL